MNFIFIDMFGFLLLLQHLDQHFCNFFSICNG